LLDAEPAESCRQVQVVVVGVGTNYATVVEAVVFVTAAPRIFHFNRAESGHPVLQNGTDFVSEVFVKGELRVVTWRHSCNEGATQTVPSEVESRVVDCHRRVDSRWRFGTVEAEDVSISAKSIIMLNTAWDQREPFFDREANREHPRSCTDFCKLRQFAGLYSRRDHTKGKFHSFVLTIRHLDLKGPVTHILNSILA
jgi:hypothetical protein